jgi:hypothetical protein
MRLTEDQLKHAQKFMDLLNSKCKGESPFRLLKARDDYSIAFVLPEFGIDIRIDGTPNEKKD